MKIATIDLGTNTFHLLIGEQTNNGYQQLFKKRIYVQLGQGGMQNAHITQAAQQRGLDAMQQFKQIMATHDIACVEAVATSAIRNAENGKEFVALIKEHTDIDVKVISGTQESMLIYAGVKATGILDHDPVLIMDIGGGSVEFIIGDGEQILWEQSFEIGAQRLLDQFHRHDPMLPEALVQLATYLSEKLQPLLQAIPTYQPVKLIGTSGAFTTLVAIHQASVNENQTDQVIYPLPLAYMQQTYETIRYMTAAERLLIPGISQDRIDMIVVSSALINFILNKSGINQIMVSSYALKMGLFSQALATISNQ